MFTVQCYSIQNRKPLTRTRLQSQFLDHNWFAMGRKHFKTDREKILWVAHWPPAPTCYENLQRVQTCLANTIIFPLDNYFSQCNLMLLGIWTSSTRRWHDTSPP